MQPRAAPRFAPAGNDPVVTTQRTLLHVFPSFAVGGQQTRFATLANRFGDAYRHVVVSLDGRDAALGLLSPGVEVELIRVARSGTQEALRTAGRTIAERRPDALITYNWGSIEWAMANRLRAPRPHLHLEDGFGRDEADRQHPRRVLTRALTLRSSTVVVPSRKLEALATASWRLRRERVRYIPNGIDASRFDAKGDAPPPFDRGGAACVIGSFSPLRPEKNLARLLRAFAGLDGDARLVLCGGGPEEAALKALAAELGLGERVIFTGHVRAPELALGAFDIFAMTSDTEQMPYAVLEAMCARLPVVATDVGDIAEMLAPENRAFVVPRDEEARLAAALRALCADAARRRAIGARNRAEVEERFTIPGMASAFGQVLDQALSGQ